MLSIAFAYFDSVESGPKEFWGLEGIGLAARFIPLSGILGRNCG
jgi:hypothetical protein